MKENTTYTIPDRESETAEFKTSFSDEVIVSLVALKYGSGFRRVREYIEVYPTMKTEFKEVPNGLLFTYSYTIQKNATKPPYYTPEMLNDEAGKRELESNKTTLEKSGQKSGQKSGLSEKQVQILNVIKDNNFVSRKELSAIIGITQSTIQKHINTLKTKKIIERIGPAKGGYWRVTV